MTERGEVDFGDTRIVYRVVRSERRHKTIEITVDEPGTVVVAAPLNTATDRIEAMVRRRAAWIVRHNGGATEDPPRRRFVSGESLPYLGRSVRLTIRPSADDHVTVRFHHWQFDVDVPPQMQGRERETRVRGAFEDWYRARAELKLPPRVRSVARLLGVQPKSILIRDQRVRWASCAPDGTLRFNWRMVMAQPSLIDYVVAHELAHLRVRTHNAEYWAVVAQAIPDYRSRRLALETIGPMLDL